MLIIFFYISGNASFPHFSIKPQNTYAIIDSNSKLPTFKCSMNYHFGELLWLKHNHSSGFLDILVENNTSRFPSKYIITGENEISINDISLEDSGKYICSNGISNDAIQASAELIVLGKLKITYL